MLLIVVIVIASYALPPFLWAWVLGPRFAEVGRRPWVYGYLGFATALPLVLAPQQFGPVTWILFALMGLAPLGLVGVPLAALWVRAGWFNLPVAGLLLLTALLVLPIPFVTPDLVEGTTLAPSAAYREAVVELAKLLALPGAGFLLGVWLGLRAKAKSLSRPTSPDADISAA